MGMRGTQSPDTTTPPRGLYVRGALAIVAPSFWLDANHCTWRTSLTNGRLYRRLGPDNGEGAAMSPLELNDPTGIQPQGFCRSA